jgi:hypothetical protein
LRRAGEKTKDYISLINDDEELIKNEDLFIRPDEAKETEFDLEPIRDFLDEYVGLVVVGFKGFKSDVVDLDQHISYSMITNISNKSNFLEIQLSSITGKKVGSLKLEVSLTGQFAERRGEEFPLWASRYRLEFYGGNSIEYIDTEDKGNIFFVAEGA